MPVYQEAKKRIKIRKEPLVELYNKLRMKDFFSENISNRIGYEFKNILYHHYTISEEIYIKLKNFVKSILGRDVLMNLFGKDDIPFDLYIGYEKFFFLEKNEQTAEFIGIMLGDGHLSEDGKTLFVALNHIDEEKYVEYIKQIFMILFNLKGEDLFLDRVGEKGIKIGTYRQSVHYAVVQLGKGIEKNGLMPGNKVKTQADVPEWVFENPEFTKSSLKGLYDTDGGITLLKSERKIILSFTNGSLSLVEDFKQMCFLLGLETSTLYPDNRGSYDVHIRAKKDVKKFLKLIRPEKIKEPFRRIYLGVSLIYLNMPKQVKTSIERQINIDYPRTYDRRYSKGYANYIKDLCEQKFRVNKINRIFDIPFLGIITNEMIDIAINKALEYERFEYSEEKAKYLKNLYEKLGSNRKIIDYLGDIGVRPIPSERIIIEHITRYLAETGIDPDTWKRTHRKKLTFYDDVNRVKEFPHSLSYEICNLIFDILYDSRLKKNDSLVLKELITYFQKFDYLLINWLFEKPRYKIALIYYFNDLTVLVRKILELLISKTKLDMKQAQKISLDPLIPFSIPTIRRFINNLKSTKQLKTLFPDSFLNFTKIG